MILSDRDIRFRLFQQKDLEIDGVDEEWIQPASVDLALDSEFIRYIDRTDEPLDPSEPVKGLEIVGANTSTGVFVLEPKDFVLAATKERVRIPADLVGRLEGKSSLARLGLIVHTTAGYVDPGFNGNLTLELFNANNRPIVLREGMAICQISFIQLTSPAENPYNGKYQDSVGPVESMYYRNYLGETLSGLWKRRPSRLSR